MNINIIFDNSILTDPAQQDLLSTGSDLSMGSMASMAVDEFDLPPGSDNDYLAAMPIASSPTESPAIKANSSTLAKTLAAPRLISYSSLSDVKKCPESRIESPLGNATFDSFQVQQSSPSKKRSASFGSSSATTSPTIASIFLQGQNESGASSLLGQFLEQKHKDAATAATVPAPPQQKKAKRTHIPTSFKPTDYRNALNAAIKRHFETSVIQTLINANPGVLLQPEEIGGYYPLHILLKDNPTDIAAANTMLSAQPEIASLVDYKGNTPLHMAVCSATTAEGSLEIIQRLCQLYPQAVKQRNLVGCTPLQLAQQRTLCPEAIANYLWEREDSQY